MKLTERLIRLLMHRSSFKSQLKAVRENIDYIVRELGQLSVSEMSKARVLAVCQEFGSTLSEVDTVAANADRNICKFIDAPSKNLGETIQSALTPIKNQLEIPLVRMHDLVESLTSLPERDSILFVLVAESATNILNAEKRFAEAAAEIKSTIEETLNECGEFKDTFASGSMPCALCGHDECLSVGILPSETSHPFYAFSSESGAGALVFNHGEEIRSVSADHLAAARKALEKRDIDSLLKMRSEVYPYCLKCSSAYCEEHWGDIDVRFDDGFYDCTYATCPKGHRAMIDD